MTGYPAHLHLNVLPRAQGRGVGPALLAAAVDRLARRRVAGVHVGVGPANARANAFWSAAASGRCGSTPTCAGSDVAL